MQENLIKNTLDSYINQSDSALIQYQIKILIYENKTITEWKRFKQKST